MALPAPTDRLVFRAWREDDLPLARALFGDPRVTAKVGGPFDDAYVQARLAGELAMQREHGFQYWPIFLADGTHVGCCGLKLGFRYTHHELYPPTGLEHPCYRLAR